MADANTPALIPRLLPGLTAVLSTYGGDPSVIVTLAMKLLRPIRFTEALTLASEESLIRALLAPHPSTNILAISIIAKAAKAPSDTAILSIMKGVVSAFTQTWLSSPVVEVGERATKALGDLLEVDCNLASAANLNAQMNGLEISTQRTPGQGLLWRRIFHDIDVYQQLIRLCSPHNPGTEDIELDERQKSLAQARLLRILPRLAVLNFAEISRSSFPEIAAQINLPDGGKGLLWFAAVYIVNKEDMLMHITLIDFFAELLDMLSMTQISGQTMAYLAELMRTVTADDMALLKSLESLAMNPNSSPELVELLVKLNEHR
jgi:hypothetical protein